IRIAFAQHRIDRATEDLRKARPQLLLRLLARLLGELRQRIPLRAQLGERRLQLRDRGTDVRQLDDVRLGSRGEATELGQVVRLTLLGPQLIGKICQDTACQGDVARLYVDRGKASEGLNDR